MDFSGIIPTLEQVAPTIATMLGGPLVGMGVQALEGFFGLTPPVSADGKVDAAARHEQIVSAVAGMTPETAIELAKVDADTKQKLVQAGVDLAKVDADDRNSARQAAVAMHDRTPTIAGILVIMGAFGMVGVVLRYGVASGVDPMLAGGLITALIALAQQAGNYLWGSSAGSMMKNALLDRWSGGVSPAGKGK